MFKSQLLTLIKSGGSRAAPSVRSLGSNVASVEASVAANTSPPFAMKGIDGWQILASVCVTRHPIMSPPMSPLEHTYSQYMNQLELENSIKSDFELQVMEDIARKVLGEDELAEVLENRDAAEERSAMEKLDLWLQEKDEFEPLRRFSYPELTSSSVGASLSRQVVLVQRYQLGSQIQWLLPQAPWQPGETLRQTCERVVSENCDQSLGIKVIGNAPIGFYKFKYPKEIRADGYLGAKVFFYRGSVGPNIRKSLALQQKALQGKDDQKWLTRQQIGEQLQNSYVKAIQQFLVDDS